MFGGCPGGGGMLGFFLVFLFLSQMDDRWCILHLEAILVLVKRHFLHFSEVLKNKKLDKNKARCSLYSDKVK
jgi:hypothetical protein